MLGVRNFLGKVLATFATVRYVKACKRAIADYIFKAGFWIGWKNHGKPNDPRKDPRPESSSKCFYVCFLETTPKRFP